MAGALRVKPLDHCDKGQIPHMTDPEVHSGMTHSQPPRTEERASTRIAHTYYSVLAGISSAHMLNDMMQPLVGALTDKYPLPYATPVGMCFTLSGVLLMSFAPGYLSLLLAVALIGCGSSVFHPQSSQAARAASAGRYGLAQSLFQIGGNLGQALGPLLVAVVVLRYGQNGRWHLAWFGLAALLAIVIL